MGDIQIKECVKVSIFMLSKASGCQYNQSNHDNNYTFFRIALDRETYSKKGHKVHEKASIRLWI